MKVELSIKDDSELRNMIKDMIRGSITSVVREEATSIINEAVQKKLDAVAFSSCEVKQLVRNKLAEDGQFPESLRKVVLDVGESYMRGIVEQRTLEVMDRIERMELRSEIAKAVKRELDNTKISINLNGEDHD